MAQKGKFISQEYFMWMKENNKNSTRPHSGKM